MRQSSTTERGQAFTLEGFVGAILLLTAVIFAQQSAVMMSDSGGDIDRAQHVQIEQQLEDVVMLSGEEAKDIVLNFDEDNNEFHNQTLPEDQPGKYDTEAFANISAFGTILEEEFIQQADNYRLSLIDHDTDESVILVTEGGETGAGDRVVSASYTVTLFEEDNLTVSDGEGEFEESDDQVGNTSNFPFSEPNERLETTPYHTVVEVRVELW